MDNDICQSFFRARVKAVFGSGCDSFRIDGIDNTEGRSKFTANEGSNEAKGDKKWIMLF